jgi:N-acetylmuramoyl-L-alanine amidase
MLFHVDYVVKEGDCILSIAQNYGFFWQTLWNDPQNASLKARRVDPNVLYPGDVVHIRDKEVKLEARPTEATHKFVKKGVPAMLRLQMLDRSQQPRANLNYTLVIDGDSRTGTTDAEGRIEEPILPNAQSAQLTIQDGDDAENYTIALGSVDPVSADSGAQQRLKNLGYSASGGDWSAAIKAFQQQSGLTPSGQLDDATRAKLKSIHGC